MTDAPTTAAATDATVPAEDSSHSSGRSVTAWVLSLVGHTIAIVVVALMVGPATPAGDEVAADRSVGIVISTVNTRETKEFLSEEDPIESESEAENTAPNLAESLPSNDRVDPTAMELPDIRSLDLPIPGLDANASLTERLAVGPIRVSGDSAAEAAFIDSERALAAERDKPPAGPPARLSLFGTGGAAGYRFVFVIDRSKSMGGQGLGALGAARDELYQQLQQLNDVHQFQIVAYHHQTVMMGPRRLIPATAEHVEAVPEYFTGLAAYGGTDHENALEVALAMEPDVVFFLTDGDEPVLSQQQIQEIQRECDGNMTIHCIEFGTGPASSESFMKRLAQSCGGDYRYIDMNDRRRIER